MKKDKMQHRNKKVKQCQSKLPTTFKKVLSLLIKQKEQIETLKLDSKIKEQILAEYEPELEYYDRILQDAKGVLSITQIAQEYNLSGMALNKILYEEKVQYKQGGQWLLYSQHMRKGYTKSVTWDNGGKTGLNTKWKQKGRLFIHELLKKRGILADMDRQESVGDE